jgi:hypothetical protein
LKKKERKRGGIEVEAREKMRRTDMETLPVMQIKGKIAHGQIELLV